MVTKCQGNQAFLAVGRQLIVAMQHRDSLFDWAIPCGTWFGVRLRLSPLFVFVAIVLSMQRWEEDNPFLAAARVATLFVLCLLVASLLHEIVHVIAVRLTGGSVNESLIWPLGGVSRLAATSATPVTAAVAGPLVNLALAAICLPTLMHGQVGWSLLDPLHLPAIDLDNEFARGFLELFFFANWIVFLANLLPALPLQVGRLLDSGLSNRFGQSLGQQTAFRAGITVGCCLIIVALLLESVWLCALGAVLIAYNLREVLKQQIAENFDESFMGYDFSQGYTSLERSVPVETEVRPGLVQRWLARRRMIREERLRQKAQDADRELDILLAKVHTYGINSLTDSERRTLKRASARYRGRTKD